MKAHYILNKRPRYAIVSIMTGGLGNNYYRFHLFVKDVGNGKRHSFKSRALANKISGQVPSLFLI